MTIHNDSLLFGGTTAQQNVKQIFFDTLKKELRKNPTPYINSLEDLLIQLDLIESAVKSRLPDLVCSSPEDIRFVEELVLESMQKIIANDDTGRSASTTVDRISGDEIQSKTSSTNVVVHQNMYPQPIERQANTSERTPSFGLWLILLCVTALMASLFANAYLLTKGNVSKSDSTKTEVRTFDDKHIDAKNLVADSMPKQQKVTPAIYECISTGSNQTRRHIKIDRAENTNDFTYRSWDNKRTLTDTPDIQIPQGKVHEEKQANCTQRVYTFDNSDWTFRAIEETCGNGMTTTRRIERLRNGTKLENQTIRCRNE